MKKKLPKKEEKIYEVPVKFKELGELFLKGFHMDWMEGSTKIKGQGNKKFPFKLTSGCGCGNGGIWIDFNGKTYSASAQDLVQLITQLKP